MFGWVKTAWNLTGGAISSLPTIAAQREKYETKIMLLEAEYKKAIEKLEAENNDLRAKVEPLTQQVKQCQHAVAFLQDQNKQLQEQVRQYESGDNPSPFGSVGL